MWISLTRSAIHSAAKTSSYQRIAGSKVFKCTPCRLFCQGLEPTQAFYPQTQTQIPSPENESQSDNVYIGQLKNGLRSGFGELITNEGVYKGHFENDILHGDGRIELFRTSEKSHVYIQESGTYIAGVLNGQGERMLKDGTIYKGEFLHGFMHGHGTLTCPRHFEYVGQFVRNKRHGFGRFTTRQGFVYEGQFTDDLESGKGSLTHHEGDSEVGEFRDGQLHGQGVKILTSGSASKQEGTFQYGVLVQGIETMRYGGTREGKFENGQFVEGCKTLRTGAKYMGFFVNDKLCGQGMHISANNLRYSGLFVDGRRAKPVTEGNEEDESNAKAPATKAPASKAPVATVTDTAGSRVSTDSEASVTEEVSATGKRSAKVSTAKNKVAAAKNTASTGTSTVSTTVDTDTRISVTSKKSISRKVSAISKAPVSDQSVISTTSHSTKEVVGPPATAPQMEEWEW